MSVTQSHVQPVLVTKREAVDRLQVSLRTVDRYIANGQLKAIRLTPRTTRITLESLEQLVTGITDSTPALPSADVDAGAPDPSHGAPALSESAALAGEGAA